MDNNLLEEKELYSETYKLAKETFKKLISKLELNSEVASKIKKPLRLGEEVFFYNNNIGINISEEHNKLFFGLHYDIKYDALWTTGKYSKVEELVEGMKVICSVLLDDFDFVKYTFDAETKEIISDYENNYNNSIVSMENILSSICK